MKNCKFINELNRLRKSSSDSIDNVEKFDQFKSYMHVVRKMEEDLKGLLRKVNASGKKTLVLLCGSAGDGKSHLLSYLKNLDEEHLIDDYFVYNDATESSAPSKTAIETLNEFLSDYRDENLASLGQNVILAINLGVLSNFIDSKYADHFCTLRKYIENIERYEIELQKRKIDVLAETITNCYTKLANKKNLIKTIVMDPETLDLKYLSEEGIEIPKDSLSAGEQQLMVISILWALAICSKKKLPVIIDTPLSRLDSLHRTALITTYFPNAGEQTIILSTDSEIDENYYELMRENVGDEFTLKYDEDSKSTSIERGYLIGAKL